MTLKVGAFMKIYSKADIVAGLKAMNAPKDSIVIMHSSLRFTKFDTAFRYHNCITDGFIGNAPTQLCDAKKMKETVELIYKNSGGEDPLSNELPIPQKWYC